MVEIYGSVGGYRAHMIARGKSIPIIAADDDVLAASLLVGSEWLDANFNSRFEGYKTNGRSQEREFPRIGHFDRDGYYIPSDEIPVEIEMATYTAANYELNSPGSLTRDLVKQPYKSLSVPGAVSLEYSNFNNVSDYQTRFKLIEDILQRLFGKSGNSSLSGSVTR